MGIPKTFVFITCKDVYNDRVRSVALLFLEHFSSWEGGGGGGGGVGGRKGEMRVSATWGRSIQRVHSKPGPSRIKPCIFLCVGWGVRTREGRQRRERERGGGRGEGGEGRGELHFVT